MKESINYVLDQSIRKMSKEHARTVRKFIERHSIMATIKDVSKENLHKSIIFRNYFLSEIDGRYLNGDMKFLSKEIHGYIRTYIKSEAAAFLKKYMHAVNDKKRILV